MLVQKLWHCDDQLASPHLDRYGRVLYKGIDGIQTCSEVDKLVVDYRYNYESLTDDQRQLLLGYKDCHWGAFLAHIDANKFILQHQQPLDVLCVEYKAIQDNGYEFYDLYSIHVLEKPTWGTLFAINGAYGYCKKYVTALQDPKSVLEMSDGVGQVIVYQEDLFLVLNLDPYDRSRIFLFLGIRPGYQKSLLANLNYLLTRREYFQLPHTEYTWEGCLKFKKKIKKYTCSLGSQLESLYDRS